MLSNCLKPKETILNEKIGHLRYCLNKLQYMFNGVDEMELEQLCIHINSLIIDMENMDKNISFDYYRRKIEELDIVCRLERYNITLNNL